MRDLRGPTSGRGRTKGDGHAGCQANVERADARRVRGVVVKIRFLGCYEVAQVSTQRGRVGLALRVLEFRNSDRRKNANNDNDDQQLD